MPCLCCFFTQKSKSLFFLIAPVQSSWDPTLKFFSWDKSDIALCGLCVAMKNPVRWQDQLLLWLFSLPVISACMFRGLASRQRNPHGFLWPGTVPHCTLLTMTIPSWSCCGWRSYSPSEKVAALPSMGAGRLERQLCRCRPGLWLDKKRADLEVLVGFLCWDETVQLSQIRGIATVLRCSVQKSVFF